jgi:hypothetical protein
MLCLKGGWANDYLKISERAKKTTFEVAVNQNWTVT